jgi:hypothetical protein
MTAVAPLKGDPPMDAAAVLSYHRDGFVLIPPGFLPGTVVGRIASAVPGLLGTPGYGAADHLRGLEQLPARGFRCHAAPPAVAGMGSFPVRVCAVADGDRP